MDDLLERQENEINVLKSIYPNDFVDLRDDVKFNPNKTNNLVKVTLYPQKSQSQDNREHFVQVDLRLKISQNYPNE